MADDAKEDKISLKKNLLRINEYVKEQTNGNTKEKEKEKKKIQLSDNDFTKTIAAMDTVAIKNGLNKLFDYLSKYPQEATQGITIKMIMEQLKAGKLINQAIEEVINVKKAG